MGQIVLPKIRENSNNSDSNCDINNENDGLYNFSNVISNVDIIKTAYESKYNSFETVESLQNKARKLWLKTWGLADDTTILCAMI